MTTSRLELPELVHREKNGEVTHNEAIRKLDVFAQPVVKDLLLAEPAGVEGERFIVLPGASGANWVGQDNKIAHYYNTEWHFYAPKIFMSFRNEANSLRYTYNGTAWIVDEPVGVALGGTVDPFTLGTTDAKLVNYTAYGQWGWGDDNDYNEVLGEITVPFSAVYTVNMQVIGTQGNNTFNEHIILKLDIANGPAAGRYDVSVYEVPSNKTNVRQVIASYTRPFIADEILSLYMYASAGLGTFTVTNCSFELKYVASSAEWGGSV